MSRTECLPCIVCGKTLYEVFNESSNQAQDGLAFKSYGQYGSTVFDPCNGEYLEINICDECITKAGEEGRVYSGMDRRPVTTDYMGQIGWEYVNRPYVEWKKGLAGYEDECYLSVEELDNLPRTIKLDIPVEQIRQFVADYETEKEAREKREGFKVVE